MSNEIKPVAKILVYGDIHLSSKNYGAHKDYPNESLGLFKNVTKTAQEVNATHIIGTGDISYGRFNTLEYRMAVEEQLEIQFRLTGGNRYELKGNHDSATYGMTEYEYYVNKGLIKPSTNIQIGNLNLSMVNHNEHRKVGIIPPEEGKTNIVLMHDYFKFENSQMPNYGEPYILDYFEPWFGVDIILGGHIHRMEAINGYIIKNGKSHHCACIYLGCPCRPSYSEGNMQDKGYYTLIKVYDAAEASANGIEPVQVEMIEFELASIEDTFNIGLRESEKERLEKKRVDVTDIAQRLAGHNNVLGEPVDKVKALTGVNEEYKEKAIDLLMTAQK